jgi:hypothetical protein
VGAGADRGRIRGVRDQPDAGLDREHHRPVAGDRPDAEAVKLVARTHQSMIWDRTPQVLRLRSALREFFPAALAAFDDLSAADTLELLGRAPDPDRAARAGTFVAADQLPGRPVEPGQPV